MNFKGLQTKNIEFEPKISKFNWLKIQQGAGNFSFLKFNETHTKEKFLMHMRNNKVFIRDYGHIPSTKNYVRITTGLEDDMDKVYNLMKEFDNNL